MIRASIEIDGRQYAVEINCEVQAPPSAPRLVVAGFQPNAIASDILRLCIRSLRRFTAMPHELWVIDNYSPAEHSDWLASEPGVNVVFNRTKPREPWRLGQLFSGTNKASHAASYANGVALELAARVIDPHTEYVVTLHQDTMACHPRWLEFLLGKLDGGCRSAGVRLDAVRTPALHVLGMVFDFQLFRSLNLSPWR